jgi:hypothetical protein
MYRFVIVVLALVAAALPAASAPADTLDPVIVSGYLLSGWSGGAFLDNSETPVVGNVALYLEVYGDDESDEPIEQPLIVHQATDGSGYFTIRTQNTPELAAAAADSGGQLNLELIADMNGWLYFESLERSFVNGVWMDDDAVAAPIALQPDNVPQCASPTGKCPPPVGPDGGGEAAGPDAPRPAAPEQCVRLHIPESRTVRPVVVGELHNPNDTESTFSYGERADSHIQKAYSLDGEVWKLKGSVHVTRGSGTSTENAAELTRGANWSHLITSDFVFTKYRIETYCPFKLRPEYSIEATRWLPSADPGADVSNFDGHCDEKPREWYHAWPADSAYHRSFSRYHQFEFAATIGAGFVGNGGGLSFGARSGLSTWVRADWTFGGAIQEHWLCGSNGPLDVADRIFAGQ